MKIRRDPLIVSPEEVNSMQNRMKNLNPATLKLLKDIGEKSSISNTYPSTRDFMRRMIIPMGNNENEIFFDIGINRYQYSQIIDDICKKYRAIIPTVSTDAIYNLVFHWLYSLKCDGKLPSERDLYQVIINKYPSLDNITHHFFYKLHGVSFNQETCQKIGIYTIWNGKNQKSEILKLFPYGLNSDFWRGMSSMFDTHDVWISVSIDAQDNMWAEEQANEQISLFNNICQDILTSMSSLLNVSIDEVSKKPERDYIVVSKKYSSYSSNNNYVKKFQRTVPWEDFYSQNKEFFDRLIPLVPKKDRTEMEDRLLRAIHFSGMARSEWANSDAFLKYMMAIEALIQKDPSHLVNQSISYQISEYASFIVSDKYQIRCNLNKCMVRLYGVRSKLVHGSYTEIKEEDFTILKTITDVLIYKFVKDPELREIINMKELDNYIQKLKFS